MRPAADVRTARPALATRAGRALGSPLRLTVVGAASAGHGAADEAAAIDLAWAAVVAEFAAVDAAMSRFRADSELAAVHRASGRATALSWRLRQALAIAHRACRSSDGRFDPRVVRSLERLGFGGARVDWPAGGSASPNASPGAAAGSFLGRVRARELRLLAPVDLGGIGKGLALRWAARAAAARLSDSGFLIDAGGDIVTLGPAPAAPSEGETAHWSIAIEDPRGGPPLATCGLLGGEAVATSSTRLARRDLPGSGEAHHLIDPSTGEPGGHGLRAVTVLTVDPAWAEVWSKTLFLGGRDHIGAEARGRGLAAWWVDDGGGLSMTPAARARTTWTRSG